MPSTEADRFHQRLMRWKREADTASIPDGFRECSRSMFDDLGEQFPFELTPVADGRIRASFADEPGKTRPSAVLLFFHGGAFLCGSPETHARFAIQLGRRIGARALLVDYRLSPEFIFPSQIEDCADAYQWLIESGQAPKTIAIAGESAGGNLCFTAQLMALSRGLPAPAATYAMSPMLDFAAEGASFVTNADTDLVSAAEVTRYMAGQYLGPVPITDPVASPLHADLSRLSPFFVQVGGDEVMVDESRAIVVRARAAGVEAEIDVVPGMQHMYQFDAGVMPEASESYDRAAAFLNRFLQH
jgi:epsilon-lactone hydrolase